MKTTKPNGNHFTATKFNVDERACIAAHSRRLGVYLRVNGDLSKMTTLDRAAFGDAAPAQLRAALAGAVIG